MNRGWHILLKFDLKMGGLECEGQRREEKKERKGGSHHKLFYSYSAPLMHVELVNNASPQCIIRATTLFFSLSHASVLLCSGFIVLPSLMDKEAT